MRKPYETVKMEASKTTSKTSSIKALVIKAWRERWTEIQWGINIKTILPRGVSGDVYNLADCILQQAMVGCGANQLVISYLKHSLSAQLVSYAAVLQRIAKFDAFHKPHCILSLLEFLDSFMDSITCRSKLEEGQLANSVSSIILWLLQVYHYTLSKYPSTNPNQTQELLEKSMALLNAIMNTDFLLAMFYLAKQEDLDEYNEIANKCQEITALMMMNTQIKAPVASHEILQKICNMDIDKVAPLDFKVESITFVLQGLIAIKVLVNPSAETQSFVNELLMVQRVKGYSLARLYCELIRASLMSLNDASGNASKQSVWAAFTFLKVPQIIQQIHSSRGSSSAEAESLEIIEAFELLLKSSPLLDILDSKCSCNCIQSLLESLARLNLVSEQHIAYFSAKRETVDTKLQKLEPTGLQGSIPLFIMRAEPTLAGILKAMGADFHKIQDSLYGMLCQVLSGKNLEAILAVATVEGKLKLFVSKLIKFNEYSLLPSQDKSNLSKAMMFDLSFLILCAIVQEYGAEAVLEENGDSFFEQWVRDCMVQKGVPKSPDQILLKCDQQKVDILIHHLISFCTTPDFDFKNSPLKSHDLCWNICGAMKEVVCAWEQGSLSANDVKRMLDAMKQKMASLAVCAAAWLCSYMNVAHHEAMLKPMNMVQQFLTPPTDLEVAQLDNFKERSALMFQVIRKMQYDVYPPTSSKVKVLTLSHSIISREPISEQLDQVWLEIKNRGWLHIETTHLVESLLNTAGAEWFVSSLVKDILKISYQNNLDKAVDLAFTMLHLDIEKCTQALLLQVLPQYLYNAKLCERLAEPQSSALAKLCVYCIYAVVDTSSSSRYPVSKKRYRQEDSEDIEALCPTNKVRRLNDNTAESSCIFQSQGQISTLQSREPLQKTLEILYKCFSQLAARDGNISPQTYFIFKFLVFAIQCGKEKAQNILQKMPNDLVPTLIKALPELFNISLILRIYDLTSNYGRNDTARELCLLRNMELRPV